VYVPGPITASDPLAFNLLKEERVAKFTIATPAGPSYGVAGGAYDLEREGMGSLDAEILEIPAGTEDEFVAAARNADALYAKGRPITKRMIDGMERCKIIALGSVGVDSVDVAAATARGIPVTNVPDTFIEEVADHAMMLILATFRRLVVQDRMVRENRWKEGPPAAPADSAAHGPDARLHRLRSRGARRGDARAGLRRADAGL
jgi:D-3-phosphoglycerate dehydrogenase